MRWSIWKSTPWTPDCHGGEAVLHDGRVVGLTTSGGYGHRTGRSYAFAFVAPGLAAPGAGFEVTILDRPRKARALGAPAYDPRNLRQRA